ncbi:MAG: ABC transporter permease [Balneolales bacterium]
MNTILYLIQKEFLQVFRNRLMLAIIIFMPIAQLVVLAYAATFEIRDINLFVIDRDMSSESRALIDRFAASENFRIIGYSTEQHAADRAILRNEATMALEIPVHAGRSLARNGHTPVSLRMDAVDGFSANIAGQYATEIINRYNAEFYPPAHAVIDVNVRHWFNPELNYRIYMVPGILVLLVTVIGGFLSGMNIVREKEIGTMEQINVTPITKSQFIIGKMVPFLILALLMFSFGLLLAKFWFHVPFEGSLALIYLLVTTYLLVALGLGLLVSTISSTQQQAILITWFIFVIFILLSGLFTPIDSMPDWVQPLTWANPVAWFIDIIRRVMLTGAGFYDVWYSYIVLLGYGLLFINAAILRYRKSTG